MDGPMDGQMDGQTDGWIDGEMDGQMEGQTDGQTDRRTDGRTDGWMDGRTDGQTDQRMDSLADGQTLVYRDGRTPLKKKNTRLRHELVTLKVTNKCVTATLFPIHPNAWSVSEYFLVTVNFYLFLILNSFPCILERLFANSIW